MAINSFDGHLGAVGVSLQELLNSVEKLEGLLAVHTSNGYSTLVSGIYDGRAITKVDYDDAMATISDLSTVWLAGGNRTNITKYLTEIPEIPE
jgi:arginine repressor